MTALSPLSMSQTKEDLVKHLGMPQETYVLMAKETDRVYKWLTKDPNHLKSNCKRNPPYDWSDVLEKKKDQAMQLIAESGDTYTSYYWNLSSPTSDCPNWIAKWFLYHKFRYRDGRKRSSVKVRGDEPSSSIPNQHSRQYSGSTEYSYAVTNYDSCPRGSMIAETNTQFQSHQAGTNTTSNPYYTNYAAPARDFAVYEQGGDTPRPRAYDPVRDI